MKAASPVAEAQVIMDREYLHIPLLHIWVDAETRQIHRMIRDNGEIDRVREVQRYNKRQGLARLHRIVIGGGQVRVIPPEDEDE